MSCKSPTGTCVNHGACNANDGCMYEPKKNPKVASTPTTASLHRGMVEALRAIDRGWPTRDGKCVCGAAVDVCLASKNAFAGCLARRALEGWEKRPPLAQDDALVRAVHDAMQNAPHDGRDFRMARAALTAVAALLYGERG